jgi:hypothetical protein
VAQELKYTCQFNVQLVCEWLNLVKSDESNANMIEVILKIKAQI